VAVQWDVAVAAKCKCSVGAQNDDVKRKELAHVGKRGISGQGGGSILLPGMVAKRRPKGGDPWVVGRQ
jgi:hypothetical protein